jgi:hypothetical protein
MLEQQGWVVSALVDGIEPPKRLWHLRKQAKETFGLWHLPVSHYEPPDGGSFFRRLFSVPHRVWVAPAARWIARSRCKVMSSCSARCRASKQGWIAACAGGAEEPRARWRQDALTGRSPR